MKLSISTHQNPRSLTAHTRKTAGRASLTASLLAVVVVSALIWLGVNPTPAAGGGIVFQSAATTTNSTAVASLAVANPAGTAAGDVLVASIALNGATVTAVPADWVQIAAVTSISNPKLYAYYHVAGAAEPASYTWTLSSAVANSGGIARYSGVDNASPLDAPAATAANATALSSLTVPPVTTTTPGAMTTGGAAIYSYSTAVTITGPGDLTQRWDLAGKRQQYDDGIQAAAGSSGSKTWTFSAGRESAGWLAALPPAGSTPSATPT